LTGELSGERSVRPHVNFDPPSGHYGALQVVARVEQLAVSQAAIDRGLAAPGSSRTADAWTAGLNWYLNPYIKWHVGFTRTIFDGDANGPRPAENLVLGRAQLVF
jgi:phosphate-selective porin